MEAPKTLRRPSNWQDFESLCKKLWGEIWNCPEIKKNGRSGQNQHGVDIYGIPKNESQDFGIQCKGKDEYTDKQFTEEEITGEIEKAKTFQPPLKKLYFATTAVKDAKIEAFVRQKNLENKTNGLFEVHIFSWEDIVDLIDENKETHNWYVKSQHFKNRKSILVTFHDNSTELEAVVPFKQTITEFKLREINPFEGLASIVQQIAIPSNFIPCVYPLFDSRINHSYFKFSLRLHNKGIDPIEDFKILLDFEGDFQDIRRVKKGGGILGPNVSYIYNTFISEKDKSGVMVPTRNILVGEDIMGFDKIKIKPGHDVTIIIIHWKLISKDYQDKGQLKLTLNPEVKKEYRTVLIDDPQKVRIESGEIEDYVTDAKAKVEGTQ